MQPIQKALIQSIFIVPIGIYKAGKFLVNSFVSENDKREMKQEAKSMAKSFTEKATYTAMDIHMILRLVLYIGMPICIFGYGIVDYFDTFGETASLLEQTIFKWANVLFFLSLCYPMWLFTSGRESIRTEFIDYFFLLFLFPFGLPFLFGLVLHFIFWCIQSIF